MPQFKPATSTFSRSDSAIMCAIKKSLAYPRRGTAAGADFPLFGGVAVHAWTYLPDYAGVADKATESVTLRSLNCRRGMAGVSGARGGEQAFETRG